MTRSPLLTLAKPMDPDKPTFFERLSSFLLRKPEDREALIKLLHGAYERHLLDADALALTFAQPVRAKRPVKEIKRYTNHAEMNQSWMG